MTAKTPPRPFEAELTVGKGMPRPFSPTLATLAAVRIVRPSDVSPVGMSQQVPLASPLKSNVRVWTPLREMGFPAKRVSHSKGQGDGPRRTGQEAHPWVDGPAVTSGSSATLDARISRASDRYASRRAQGNAPASRHARTSQPGSCVCVQSRKRHPCAAEAISGNTLRRPCSCPTMGRLLSPGSSMTIPAPGMETMRRATVV